MSTPLPRLEHQPLHVTPAPVFYIVNNGRFCDAFGEEYPALLVAIHDNVSWEEAWAAHVAGHELVVPRPARDSDALFTVARLHEGFRRMIALEYTTVIS